MVRRRNTPNDSSEDEELRHLARGYAEFMMQNAGRVRSALLANTDDGIILYLPETIGDEPAKQNSANTARLIAVWYRATAVAFVMESWVKFAQPGRPLDSTPPSESQDREECVLISLETARRQSTDMLMNQRDRTGKFAGFASPNVAELTDFQARFAQVMPPKPPGEKDTATARQLLRMTGVEPENHGFNPSWN